jgi:hypothetical protein
MSAHGQPLQLFLGCMPIDKSSRSRMLRPQSAVKGQTSFFGQDRDLTAGPYGPDPCNLTFASERAIRIGSLLANKVITQTAQAWTRDST